MRYLSRKIKIMKMHLGELKIKHFTLILIVALVSGCANTWHSHTDGDDGHHQDGNRQFKQQSAAQGTINQDYNLPPFFRHLADGYLELSKDENYEHHFGEVEVFADKSRRAAKGEHVIPHYVNQRAVPKNTVYELETARARLMRVAQTSVFRTHPFELARAQVKFDCWLEEQEENINQNDIETCKSEFYRLMDLLDPMGKRQAPKAQTHVEQDLVLAGPDDEGPFVDCKCKLKPKAAAQKKRFIVYFDLDQAIIREDAAEVLERVKKYYFETKPAEIIVQGHTDRSGNNQYNQSLSTRRSNSVMQALRLAGLPKDKIKKGQYGENKPQVPTKDGKRLQENRRVEIWFIYN
jgi:OmpA-OmpF porin, OOP family